MMDTKPGLRTTEFWMHLILQVILLLNTIQVWDYMPPKYTVLVQGILGAAYAWSRGLAKQSPVVITPPADATDPTAANTTEAPAAK